MSKNLPEQQPTEEVDLGQLFKLIGRAFERFFNFIGSIFNKLFLAFVWLVFFVKRHFLILVISGIIGITFGFAHKKLTSPVYKSSAVFKQNYQTGESLYTLLDFYNELISEEDSIALGNALQITPLKASALSNFEVESILNNNQKLKLFDNYTKELDSTLATTVDYADFLDNSDEFNYRLQRITLKARSTNNFDEVFEAIANTLESSSYFKNEQRKDLEELERRELLLLESLRDSDSLQEVYKTVLEKSVEKSTTGSQTSVTIDNKEDKSVTKEFELYNSDIGLRRELVSIRREKEDVASIIEIVSMQQGEGTIDDAFNLLGLEVKGKLILGILFTLITFLTLLSIELIKYLERFKDKV